MNRMQPIIRLMSHLFFFSLTLCDPSTRAATPSILETGALQGFFFPRPLCIAASSKLAVCSFSGSLTNRPRSISATASNQQLQLLLQHISVTIIFSRLPPSSSSSSSLPPRHNYLPTYLQHSAVHHQVPVI
jgi:hypothetical protein